MLKVKSTHYKEKEARVKKALPVLIALWVSFSFGVGVEPRPAAPASSPNPDFGSLPLAFVPNRGQAAEPVLFFARTPGHAVWLTRDALVFDSHEGAAAEAGRTASREVTRFELLGAAADPVVTGQGPSRGAVHFLRGRDPSGWTTGVETSAAVLYRGLYPEIDFKVYGTGRALEYDWIVSPGGDVADIAFRISGASEPFLDRDGNLVVRSRHGEWTHRRPTAYQVVDGKRVEVAAAFRTDEAGVFGLSVPTYDPSLPLVIDPIVTLQYSTFLGGSGDDVANAVSVSTGGNVYIAGGTDSADFPVKSGFSLEPAAKSDVFVAKLAEDGKGLIYSTYIGGAGNDAATAIAVNRAVAFIAGTTDSPDFPVKNALQDKLGGGRDAFVVRLHANGAELDYSTYLGGANADEGRAVAVDEQGNAYVAGRSDSPGFPLLVPIRAKMEGGEAFVAKLSPRGSALVYSTFLGGNGKDEASAIALGPRGAVFVTGTTFSPDFPVLNASDRSYNGAGDAFVAQIAESGRALAYATFLGGTAGDAGYAIALDASSEAVVTGQTSSADFPVRSAFDRSLGGGADAFVTKLSADGKTLGYSTYLGGSGEDAGLGIAVDAEGTAYVTGFTTSPDFPRLNGPDPTPGLGRDAFLTGLAATGKKVLFSTYLGGSRNETGLAVGQDGLKNIYVAGTTTSPDFPTRGAFDPSPNGLKDAFLTKYALGKIMIVNAELVYDLTDIPLPQGAGSIGEDTDDTGRELDGIIPPHEIRIIGQGFGSAQGGKMLFCDGVPVPVDRTISWNDDLIRLSTLGWLDPPVYWDHVYSFAVREGGTPISNIHAQRFLIPIFLAFNWPIYPGGDIFFIIGDGFGDAPGSNILHIGPYFDDTTTALLIWTNTMIAGYCLHLPEGTDHFAFIQRGSVIISWRTLIGLFSGPS